MEHEPTIGNSTTVTLGIMGTVAVVIASGFFVYGQLDKQVGINTEDLQKQMSEIRELPTREEFSALTSDIKEIKRDIKELIQKK